MEDYRRVLQEIANKGDGCSLYVSHEDADMLIVKELWEKGFIEGNNATADDQIGFLNVRLNMSGRRILEQFNANRPCVWKKFVRLSKIAKVVIFMVASILLTVIGFLADLKTIFS